MRDSNEFVNQSQSQNIQMKNSPNILKETKEKKKKTFKVDLKKDNTCHQVKENKPILKVK